MNWRRASWLVCLGGIADAYLWGFDVDDQWQLRHGNPAHGTLALLPKGRRPRATLREALWIADCIAFDHDAPVGLMPTRWNRLAAQLPRPISPAQHPISSSWYFEDVALAYFAAAEIRFGDSYVLRYGVPNALLTNFSERFAGHENLVTLYAMASRQADLLSEFLCLYRVVEAADGKNGIAFLTANLGGVGSHRFGTLRVVRPESTRGWVNAFSVYRRRARQHIRRLGASGIAGEENVASYLYRLRNALAHGKHDTLVGDYGSQLGEVAAALPLLKLVARIAVET